MTEFNVNVKIHRVDPLFVGEEYRTEVWISKQAAKKLEKFVRKSETGQRFIRKLATYAEEGFTNWEGGPLCLEWDDVWRIGHSATLFRLIGFYERRPDCWIAIDAITKKGQKLSSADRERINAVARVKRQKAWVKQ